MGADITALSKRSAASYCFRGKSFSRSMTAIDRKYIATISMNSISATIRITIVIDASETAITIQSMILPQTVIVIAKYTIVSSKSALEHSTSIPVIKTRISLSIPELLSSSASCLFINDSNPVKDCSKSEIIDPHPVLLHKRATFTDIMNNEDMRDFNGVEKRFAGLNLKIRYARAVRCR